MKKFGSREDGLSGNNKIVFAISDLSFYKKGNQK
jgi:hypothetical protein